MSRWQVAVRPVQAAASWIDKSISGVIRRILSFAEHRMALLAGLVLAAVVTVSAVYWDETEQIRNVGLVVAAIIALPVAVWRSRVADQQVGVAQQQANIAQQSVLNERYQKSAEMLGSAVLSVRLGGIVALERLALEHPAQYHAEVMKLLFAFIRQPIEDEQARNVPMLDMRGARPDVQTAVDVVRTCRSRNSTLEANSILWIDLRGANLRQADLTNIDLSVADVTELSGIAGDPFGVSTRRVVLSHADLSRAQLRVATMPRCLCDKTNFTGADLGGAELRETTFLQADLRGASLAAADLAGANFLLSNLRNARFDETNLSGAEFAEAAPGEAGLTQEQLDQACADPDNPPELHKMFDAKTGERLEWRGKECEKVFEKLDLNPRLWSR